VVFVCENNLWMEYTRTTDITAVEHPAADRASAYGMERILVDGNDVDAVFEVAKTAIDRARAGEGPSMIEALTYRQAGHSRADPGKYRPDEEVAEWLAKDPIPMYHARLLSEGVSEETLADIDRKVAAMVDLATEEAKAGEAPGREYLMKDVWADGGSAWRN
jgi:pyruvate dehydrogenase E1 component alpha subunit